VRPSPEARLLVESAREPAGGDPEEIRLAASAVRDWARVASLATRHRVASYVLRALRTSPVDIPTAAVDALNAGVIEQAARTTLNDRLLGAVLPALSARGVRTILLKGPALARSVYPEPELRPYDDLDLLVRPCDERSAAGAVATLDLVESGDEPPGSRPPGTAAFHRRFEGSGGLTLLELHTDCLQLGIEPVAEEGRWARAVPVPGLPGALMLSPADSVVHLAVHAQKHGFARLVHLKDLDLTVRGAPDLDWGRVIAAAREEGVLVPVWYALRMARDMLGTPVPPTSLRGVRPGAPMRALIQAVTPRARVMRLEGFTRRRTTQFVVEDSWRGMLPSLLLLGRRAHRMRVMVRAAVGTRSA